MIVWDTRGRTASWNRTLHSSVPSASRARLVDSLRVWPPSTIWVTLAYPPFCTIARTGSRYPGVIRITISSIKGEASNAAIVCSMIVLPAILISCLGIESPTLVPVPPARMTATLRSSVTR